MQRLNPKFLIQQLKTLLVELIKTHSFFQYLITYSLETNYLINLAFNYLTNHHQLYWPNIVS